MSLGAVVLPFLVVISAEDAIEIFGVLVAFIDDRRSVGVRQNVFLKPFILRDNVIDDGAEKGDIAPGSDADVQVGAGASARETRVDMDDLRAVFAGLYGPAETDGMGLGHVRAHDENAIAVREVLLKVGGRAAAKRGAKTRY